MKYIIVAMILMLGACGDVRLPEIVVPPVVSSIKTTALTIEQPKTSGDADRQIKDLQNENQAAAALIAKNDAAVKALEAEKKALIAAEYSSTLRLYAIFTLIAGLLATGIGIFLKIRFLGSKTATAILGTGIIVTVLGLFCTIYASAIVAYFGYGIGAVVILGTIIGITYLAHNHSKLAENVWDKSREEILATPDLVNRLTKAGIKNVTDIKL